MKWKDFDPIHIYENGFERHFFRKITPNNCISLPKVEYTQLLMEGLGVAGNGIA